MIPQLPYPHPTTISEMRRGIQFDDKTPEGRIRHLRYLNQLDTYHRMTDPSREALKASLILKQN